MRLHLLGVRGSTPTPGPDQARHGGNTSCIAVETDGAVRVVLDAGTGLRSLPRLLDHRPFVGTLLLTHLHWDHTHGLPFCGAMDHPDASTCVLGPVESGLTLERSLAGAMSPPNFPIGPEGLRGTWTWEPASEGHRRVQGLDVLVREVPHKGGRTLGYRLDDGERAVAYLPDHMPQAYGSGPDGWGEYHAAALELARDVDVLVHDAQYTAAELPDRGAFGHAAAEYAVALGARAGARHVVLFHHDPNRTDDEVDEIVDGFRPGEGPLVTAAMEGTTLVVQRRAVSRG